MITSATSQKLVVISDLHLGNPFSTTRDKALQFLKWAASRQFDICINGDGLDIAQSSFSKLATEIPEMIRIIKEINKLGRSVYYVVGNHDIALEHFLEDWGPLKVSPFLNITSGSSRIRVEHGHLYDPFFVKHPHAYEVLTWLAGFLLKINPNMYKAWIWLEKYRANLRAKRTGIVGEPPEFAEAAYELSRRGFDVIIFGHTHHSGQVTFENNKKYFNPGSWLLNCDYIEIDNGHVSLRTWEASVKVLA